MSVTQFSARQRATDDPPRPQPTTVELLTAILAAINRLDKRFDEYAGVNLNAKFPYGKPNDRWRSRG